MKRTLLLLTLLLAIATVSAQDTLHVVPTYMPKDKKAAAETMILNAFTIKNNNNCTIEEFAELVLGSKYAVYFPPSAKPLKESYVKKFMKSADFTAFKAEKVKTFDTEPRYKKMHDRSSEQLIVFLSNMGFNVLEIGKTMLETFKKYKLYVTYAIFKEIFGVE
jgi:hypothetical protein